jgi:hypothetical protein
MGARQPAILLPYTCGKESGNRSLQPFLLDRWVAKSAGEGGKPLYNAAQLKFSLFSAQGYRPELDSVRTRLEVRWRR